MFSVKYIKVYNIRMAILSAIQCFFFHENILFTCGEVIALSVTAYIIHRQIFGHFLPPLAQIFNQICLLILKL